MALLVNGVTKLKSLVYESKEERQAENLRKMFLAMSKDIRVLIIKLADRLHNLRTIDYMNQNQIIEKCKETWKSCTSRQPSGYLRDEVRIGRHRIQRIRV